jgi:hypothetical protein
MSKEFSKSHKDCTAITPETLDKKVSAEGDYE